jgi:hypothetical protein
MAAEITEAGDRLVLYLDPGGPIELAELTDSFAALARMYARHYRSSADAEATPKLFVTKLSSGSVRAEIAPCALLLGQAYLAMGGAVTIADFAGRLNRGLRAFAGLDAAAVPVQPSRDDTSDLREFVKPLTGRARAQLGISHARYHEREGTREVVVEYTFDEASINRAALAMDRSLESEPEKPATSTRPMSEVLLYFDVASRAAGKEKGRTHDRAIVPEVTDKPLPTYFRKGVSGDPKDAIRRDGANPIANTGYIVDVLAQVIDGEPKMYIVTQVYDSVSLDV